VFCVSLDKRVKFFGRVPHERVFDFIATANVCVLPLSKVKSNEWNSIYSVLKIGEY
jgi:hypothetical protein